MPTFNWTAKTKQNSNVSGCIEALDWYDAESRICQMGYLNPYQVTSIQEDDQDLENEEICQEYNNVALPSRNANKEIYQYVHDRKGRKVGVLLGRIIDNRVRVAWSKCHCPLDKFDRQRGLNIARSRCNFSQNSQRIPELPSPISSVYDRFIDRVSRYFKVPQDSVEVY